MPLTPQRQVKIISLFVALVGLLVIIGWIFDIYFFKTIIPATISMKFTTAISFIASSILLFFATESLENRKDYSAVFLPISILVIVLIILPLFVSQFFNLTTGIEDLFISDQNSIETEFQGRPAITTMINFLLIVLSGLYILSNSKKLISNLKWLGTAILINSVSALFGYILNYPFLYTLFPDYSNAIAIPTAFLFVLIGYALFLLGNKNEH